MQTVRVNNRIFNSISKAAKFIGVQRSNLSNLMRGKKAITYKDLLVEKMDDHKPVKKRVGNGKGNPVPVIVDGVAYNSCSEAEKTLGLSSCLISHAIKRGSKTVAGHTVEPVFPSAVKVKENACRVYCETTGVVYASILEAARVAGADSWTMGKKMEASGAFIDSAGRVYKRLKPMKSKNVYKDTGSELKMKRAFAHRKVNNDVALPVVEKPTVIKEVKPVVPQVVRDAINDKIIKILKDKGVYNEIIELLNYGGFSTIKLENENA